MKPLPLALLSIALLAASPNTERQRAEHALNRLAFGAKPGDVERVMRIGVDRWIEQQLHPERIADAAVERRLARFDTLRMSETEIAAEFLEPIAKARGDEDMLRDARRNGRRVVEELTAQRILRAAESERQLNEVMVDFWMNHFNVFAGKGIDRFLLTSYERDTIRPRIWGKFEDLVLATAKSPAMLFYLDNARSRRDAINENYARELMELHTLGVDGGYTQKDVTELARVLTGWSIRRPQEGTAGFLYRPFAHDAREKTVLGTRIAVGGGMEEGERMIRLLARHPSTARHIAFKLAQRLVADDPPKALVDRVAKRFTETGGDLRATVKAVIDSPEFWQTYRGKLKSPFEYAISAIRATGAQVDNARPLARELQKIGQPLYFAQPPTGWSDTADAWENSGALLARLNFAIALTSNKMPGVRVATLDIPIDLSPNTRKALEGKDAQTTAALKLGSPEFQRQ